MTAPQFSVVIPAFNAVGTIGETIASVQAQTEHDFELVVVDDGSTDGTPELVERIALDDSRITVHRQANQGVAGARNTGIRLSSAPLIGFVDNDDLWMPNYLTAMGDALNADERAGFAYTDAYLLDDHATRIERRTSLEHHEPISPDLVPEEMLARLIDTNFVISSVMARRTALEDTGGFEVLVNGVDDWDLWLRMVASGWMAIYGGACALIQRDRWDSQSKNETMMLARSEIVLLRVLEDERYSDEVKAIAKARLDNVQYRIRRELSFGPMMTAIRARRKLMLLRDRVRPERRWREHPPADVAQAFPDIAARYGRVRPTSAS